MLKSKLLGITDETVCKENDVDKLIHWKIQTMNLIIDIKRRLELTADNGELVRAKDAKKYQVQLLNLIEVRIKSVRKKESDDVKLMRKFMKVAKKELGGEQYKRLLEKAKILVITEK